MELGIQGRQSDSTAHGQQSFKAHLKESSQMNFPANQLFSKTNVIIFN